MKTIIIYKSQTGFTERYGKWIAEELGCEAMDVKSATEQIIKNYDLIIYGGGICAGQISGLKQMKRLLQPINNKKLIVFGTGGTPVEVTDNINTIRNSNFTDEEKEVIPFYYFQSGINYDRMKLPARLLMKAFSYAMEKKKDKTSDESGMAASIKNSYDITDRKLIQPLVAYVKSL